MAYTKIAGIYKIVCKENQKVYIGKSVNIKVRWCRHRYDLRDGIHWNRQLQQDYDKYGLEGFQFEIIHKIPNDAEPQSLDELEKEFIKLYNSFEEGYNETLGGTGNLGKTFSQEVRDKMSKSRKGRKHTKESIDKISNSKKKRLIINGGLYVGMEDTALKLGIDKGTLLKRLRSESYKDYQFETTLSKCRTTSRKA
ncbi:GIY-YIG nuclease family protein [Bacillus haynesii]|nr:GIY-YIG nuclease family protein [Bacillus haynesii]MEC0739206.1 GIY-YIG nuclease family protein [Bacillus haynesii]